MKYTYSIFFVLILCVLTNAQKQDYVWTFGGDGSPAAGIQGMQIDYKDDHFNVKELNIPYRNISSHASICDAEGNLLFYTNGCAIMNKNHQVMLNGVTLNDDYWKELLNWDDCKYGYPGVQNDVILPDPNNEYGYYLIHKPNTLKTALDSTVEELWHTYIDMSLNDGLGDVVYFDSLIYDEIPLLFANLEAVPHQNGIDWWLLQPLVSDSVFLTFLIDSEGIHRMDDQNTHQFYDIHRSSASGTSRLSPDGSQFAIYNYYDNLSLFDIDRSTGLLSNHQKVILNPNPDRDKIVFGSVEWSPNSRFLYIASSDTLQQIDLWNDDPQQAITLIDVYDGTQNPFANNFYLQTLGPDCRIYISSTNGNKTYHVINKPNQLGLDCDFHQNGIQLPQNHSTANVPLFPRFRVDEEEKCDSTISSVFGDLVYYRRDLSVYPNPAIDKITIEIPRDLNQVDLIIYNQQRKILVQRTIQSWNHKWQEDLSLFPNGIYVIEIIPSDLSNRILYNSQIVKVDN